MIRIYDETSGKQKQFWHALHDKLVKLPWVVSTDSVDSVDLWIVHTLIEAHVKLTHLRYRSVTTNIKHFTATFSECLHRDQNP